MEGQRQMGKPLQLLITLSLFILTNQFEVRGDVLEKLSFDTAAELHLRGTSDSEIQELQEILSGNSLINQQFLLQKDLDAVLNKQQMEDQRRSVSESSPSFRQEVLVLTGSKDSSDGRMRQGSSLDPQKRVPVFLYDQSCLSELDSSTGEETFTQNQQTGSGCSGSSDSLTLKIKPEAAADLSNHGNTTLNSGVIFFKASMVHGPVEPDQENPQIYRGIQEPDPVPGSRSPQRPDDPVQLQILMLEDDEVVRTSAASLYAKHPAVSSVHVVDPQQRVHQVKGQPVVLSEHSSLVLVGHGARDRSGEMRISGYTSKDVARIIQKSSRISQKIQTTTVVACEAGSDQRFREALLKELHEAGIETELHLWTAVVQVTESGEVISQDGSADGAQWRSGDDTKKVVLTVGSNGEIRRRKETDHRGREVLTNQTRLLGNNQNHPEGKSWPERPTLFIDPEIYNMTDQNKTTEITEDFRMLEAFTWALFYPKPGAVIKKCPEGNDHYVIGKIVKKEKEEEEEEVTQNDNGKRHAKKKNDKNENQEEYMTPEDVQKSCYDISSGKEIKNIIRHYAKDGEKKPTFLMVDKWIFRINSKSLYVTPAGKYVDQNEMDSDTKDSIKKKINGLNGKKNNINNNIKNNKNDSKKNQKSTERYSEIKAIGEKEEKKQYRQYVRRIFSGKSTNKLVKSDRLFSAWYFTASVIIESARNFRTFPITLMAMDMDKRYVGNKPDFWFVNHSMATGGTWIDESRRGFSGSAGPCFNKMTKADQIKLSDVLKREHMVFKRWKESIGNVDMTQNMTEIAVKYKVLDKKNTFEADCLNFIEKAKFESNCEGEPSGSASKGASEKPGINTAKKPAHSSKKRP